MSGIAFRVRGREAHDINYDEGIFLTSVIMVVLISLQGTGAGQDPRFKDKTKKLLKNIKSSAPKEYEKKVR